MLEIFEYQFMLRAFGAGIIVAAIAPLIGTFLVVKRFSLMAETLAHVSLLGVAIGLLTNIPPLLSATITAGVVSLGMERLRSSTKIFGESVLALFLSGSLALSALLISLARGFNTNLFSYLFGSITTVSSEDLITISVLALIVVIVLLLCFKEIFFVAFDEDLAQASGLKAKRMNTLLVVLAAVTVAISMRIVGILLIGALMVIPVLTAIQLAKSFRQVLGLSVIIAEIGVILGLFASYYFNLAPGGAIVLILLLAFCICSFFNSFKKRWGKRRL